MTVTSISVVPVKNMSQDVSNMFEGYPLFATCHFSFAADACSATVRNQQPPLGMRATLRFFLYPSVVFHGDGG